LPPYLNEFRAKEYYKTNNMKSFKSTAWLLPQPVLIIGTYDKNGKPNAINAARTVAVEIIVQTR